MRIRITYQVDTIDQALEILKDKKCWIKKVEIE